MQQQHFALLLHQFSTECSTPSKAHPLFEHGGGGGNFSAKNHMPFSQRGGPECSFSEDFDRFSPQVDPLKRWNGSEDKQNDVSSRPQGCARKQDEGCLPHFLFFHRFSTSVISEAYGTFKPSASIWPIRIEIFRFAASRLTMPVLPTPDTSASFF